MRVGHLNVTRAAWYDRQPSMQKAAVGIASSTLPATFTTQASYTVPSNRQAYIDLVTYDVQLAVAWTVGTFAQVGISVIGSVLSYNILAMYLRVNTVGTRILATLSQVGVINAGDQVRIGAQSDTDGKFDETVTVKLTEYAAL